MAGITLAQAQAQLDAYLQAETDILTKGQSYTIGDRTLTRANLQWIQSSIKYWDSVVKRLSGGRRVRGVTPID